ncbi:MAG: sugar phosphate isomerase/epimerase [Petrimonas sp.]|nr:sugar phosphate isomerase/epimerase [Petrimonas sp.]MEA4980642.1 sugar phosphate isomerase/epimerase [Petrimonas sp.]MEA5062690.1 sugar phosphate isomerase/epimerase [Petrimonas sp.]OJV34720.1 MAG: sugar phosphate isomerase [Bacteroidia bacterium 43-41]
MKKIANLFIVALVGSLFVLSGCNQEQKEEAEGVKVKKEIYLQLYSVRDDIKANYQATIDTVAKAGYTGVEAAGYNEGLFYGMAPADFKKSIEDAGLEVLSSHTGHPLAENVKDTNWDEVWKWWDTAIQAHKDAGMKYLVVAWIPTPKTLADLQAYCDYFNKIGEKCNAAGIRFGYHNHNFEFTEIEGEMMYDYMLKNTDPAKVFFQMDVYWVVRGGQSPVDYFNTYPGRFEILHIKDNKELGQSGMVGFDAIFRNIDKAGTKNIVVEVEKYSGTPFEGIKESYNYLANADYVKASYK